MKFLKILGIILFLGLFFFFFGAAKIADRQFNTVFLKETPTVSKAAQQLHAQLNIADWHSDNLLWDRNILDRLSHGHVDIPRLIEGNFTLQVFDAVIKTPRGQNYQATDANSDNITVLAIGNRWPSRTWSSLKERAIYQSELLHEAAKKEDRLRIIKSKADLQNLLTQRKTQKDLIGGLLSVEGLHALEGDIKNIDELYQAGYRMMGLTHFFDNRIAGSSSGMQKGGLTDLGRRVVKKLNEQNIIIDLAHSSSATIKEVLALTTRPIVVSHTGVQGTIPGNRNLSDAELKAIAQNGGLIGIGFWEGAIGEIEPSSIVKTIRYVVDLIGIEYVSLGSDFDGSTHVYFDASQIVVLTEALLQGGFSEQEIRKIMGDNQLNFLAKYLPDN